MLWILATKKSRQMGGSEYFGYKLVMCEFYTGTMPYLDICM